MCPIEQWREHAERRRYEMKAGRRAKRAMRKRRDRGARPSWLQMITWSGCGVFMMPVCGGEPAPRLTAGKPRPAGGPPSGHPERLAGAEFLSASERELWASMGDIDWE
jgi:hypothetical protein